MEDLVSFISTGYCHEVSHATNASVLRASYAKDPTLENALEFLSYAARVGERYIPNDSILTAAMDMVEKGFEGNKGFNGGLSARLRHLGILLDVANAYPLNDRSVKYCSMVNAHYSAIHAQEAETNPQDRPMVVH